jgi:two-component sensor histidine kinase
MVRRAAVDDQRLPGLRLLPRKPMLPETPLPAVALTLALAVVGSSTAPLLLLDGGGYVLASSASFKSAFGLPPGETVGRSIYALGDGEWNVPRLRSLLDAITSGAAEVPAYEIDLMLPGRGKRRLVLNAQRLHYSDPADDSPGVRVLLAVADVTDARHTEVLRKELLREKVVLLEEIHHRVANSLQIIASVLMQSARRVGSDESSSHLRDAHTRVMAIADLERQLAESSTAGVDVGVYLVQLCGSLGASMIENHDRIRLAATGDGSIVSANASISIGLIVTELVINALKHGFPDKRNGTIRVRYVAKGDDWTLTVADDGVGMTGDAPPTAGLGTNIVTALARHLEADVTTSDNQPGVTVTVHHDERAHPADETCDDELAI